MSIGRESRGYLHDAAVLHIVFGFDATNCRELTITVKCVPDAGDPAWDDKLVVVRLQDVVLSRHIVFGAMAGGESLDRWGSDVSPEMFVEQQRLRAAGAGMDGECFCFTFHSGSVLEGVCKRIVVELAT